MMRLVLPDWDRGMPVVSTTRSPALTRPSSLAELMAWEIPLSDARLYIVPRSSSDLRPQGVLVVVKARRTDFLIRPTRTDGLGNPSTNKTNIFWRNFKG